MPESERLIKFQLLGQDFAFYTGASDEEMERILSLVRRHIEDSSGQGGGTIPVSKVAVMACLNLASRYIRLQNDYNNYRKQTEDKLGALNERIDTLLPTEK